MFSGFVVISGALVLNGVAVLYDKPRSRREHLSGLLTGLFILALQLLVGFYLS
jgi:multisubunit Na+/H+ antiporter MnhB subunit